jgi:integrase
MTQRRLQAIPNQPGILKVLTLNKKTGRWDEPKRGKKFLASFYRKDFDGKLKKKKKYFSIFSEAKAFREGKRSLELKKEDRPVAAMSFGQLVENWKQIFLPTINLSTQIRYRSYLKHLTFFNDLLVENIETTDVDRWIIHIKDPTYLSQRHSTRCSYNHEYSILKGIIVFYVSRFNRNYRLPLIPEHRKMLKVKEKPKANKDLTVEQFKGFIEALGNSLLGTRWEKIYHLALMQYATYTRVQEAAALHYEDFDFGRNKVIVNKKVQWLRAKGYEDRIVDGSKVNGGKELPMSDLARKVFHELVLRFGIRSGPLFQVDGKIITYRQIEHKYSKALKTVGLPFTATHILRHASLTEFYDTCKDLIQTAKVAGHGDIKSTMKYAKVRDERVIQTQKEMDQKLLSLFPKSCLTPLG